MLEKQHIQNNWPRIKSEVLSKWRKLSEAEVEKTHGNPNDLGKLIKSKYGSSFDTDFNNTYENICNSHTKSTSVRNYQVYNSLDDNKLEDQGLDLLDLEIETAADESFKTYGDHIKTDSEPNFNRETDDELSAYTSPKKSVDDHEIDEEYAKLDTENDDENIQFTTTDELYPFQNLSNNREDITLGRSHSSATNLSTAKAAPNSSAASLNDAKKK